MIPLAVAGLALAAWAYLLLGRGFFWRCAERDDPRRVGNANALPTAARIRPALVGPHHHASHGPPPPSATGEDQGRSADPPPRSGGGGERSEPEGAHVVAIIPARNEAETIATAVSALLAQDYPSERLRVIVVDDQSSDGTAALAQGAGGSTGRVEVVAGTPLPAGWTGKVWAMAQGVRRASETEPVPAYILFQDADIAFDPGVISSLVATARAQNAILLSLMAKLRCDSPAEKLLVPAFVFFFQKLYPFAWVNDPESRTAAAAGGCMLVRADALAAAGGLAAIRSAIIDDCALARLLKPHGPIRLGLTHSVTSLRPYPKLGDIRRMVGRSAYAELRYSPWRLAGTVAGMAIIYLAPPLLAVFARGLPQILGGAAWLAMTLAYLPMLRFYRRSPLWAPLLPVAAGLYTAFTLDSAFQHWRGRGGAWKGRYQAAAERAR
ncbi:MAG TPA: glycosyltransferase [Hyphomicrobiales bacterium]|nr:glycosyltransferase [Hyphomicrobiales bacterium]